MKGGRRRVFRYSSTHEKALPNRSYRRRMELHPASHMPAPKGHGRPRVHDLREILNAVFFCILKSGCQWRLLPHDFPRWPTLYHSFRRWCIDGTWERINRAILERLRVRLRRDPQPSSAGVVDSQGRSKSPRSRRPLDGRWGSSGIRPPLTRTCREAGLGRQLRPG